MKLLDLINEGELDKDKLIKRYHTIYKALKKGVLKSGNFGKIYYELPDNYQIDIDVDGTGFIGVGEIGTDNEVKFYYVNDTNGEITQNSVKEKQYKQILHRIESSKFKPFNMVLYFRSNLGGSKIEEVNEEEIGSVEDKIQKKKVRTIYKSLKKGKDSEYGYYELPDKYRFIGKNELISSLHHDTDNDTLFIMVDDGDSKNIKFFFQSSVNDIMEPFEPPNRAWYINRLAHINKRFGHFNMKIFYPYSDDMLRIWNDLSMTPTTSNGTSDTQN